MYAVMNLSKRGRIEPILIDDDKNAIVGAFRAFAYLSLNCRVFKNMIRKCFELFNIVLLRHKQYVSSIKMEFVYLQDHRTVIS